MSLNRPKKVVPELTWRSPGKNVLQMAYSQSNVRMHAVVRMFHIFREPFDPEARSSSVELSDSVRISVRCPGRSREYVRVTSGGSSDFVLGFRGILWISNALLFNAKRICWRLNLNISHIVRVVDNVHLDTAFRDSRVDEVKGSNLTAASDSQVG